MIEPLYICKHESGAEVYPRISDRRKAIQDIGFKLLPESWHGWWASVSGMPLTYYLGNTDDFPRDQILDSLERVFAEFKKYAPRLSYKIVNTREESHFAIDVAQRDDQYFIDNPYVIGYNIFLQTGGYFGKGDRVGDTVINPSMMFWFGPWKLTPPGYVSFELFIAHELDHGHGAGHLDKAKVGDALMNPVYQFPTWTSGIFAPVDIINLYAVYGLNSKVSYSLWRDAWVKYRKRPEDQE